MKKLLLLLITLTTLTNVSYASFPVADTLKTESISDYHLRLKNMGIDTPADCDCTTCSSVLKTEVQTEKDYRRLILKIFAILSILSYIFFRIILHLLFPQEVFLTYIHDIIAGVFALASLIYFSL
jgi:hypothetical protein